MGIHRSCWKALTFADLFGACLAANELYVDHIAVTQLVPMILDEIVRSRLGTAIMRPIIWIVRNTAALRIDHDNAALATIATIAVAPQQISLLGIDRHRTNANYWNERPVVAQFETF